MLCKNIVLKSYYFYYDFLLQEWNKDLLEKAGLPMHFLPTVIESGGIAGKLKQSWYNIPANTPVLASLGVVVYFVFYLMYSDELDFLTLFKTQGLSALK